MIAAVLIIMSLLAPMYANEFFATEDGDSYWNYIGEEKDYQFDPKTRELEAIEYSIQIMFGGGSDFDDAELYAVFFESDTYTDLVGELFDWSIDFVSETPEWRQEYLIGLESDFPSTPFIDITDWFDTGRYYAVGCWANGTKDGDENIDSQYFVTWYANKLGRVIVYENVTLPESQWVSDTWDFALNLIELYGAYSIPGIGVGISGVSHLVKKRREKHAEENIDASNVLKPSGRNGHVYQGIT